jgi:hypothetical protein
MSGVLYSHFVPRFDIVHRCQSELGKQAKVWHLSSSFEGGPGRRMKKVQHPSIALVHVFVAVRHANRDRVREPVIDAETSQMDTDALQQHEHSGCGGKQRNGAADAEQSLVRVETH